MEQKKRSFKIFGSDIGFSSPPNQYYWGVEPGSVAKKFGSMLFKLINNEDSKYYKFKHKELINLVLRETTKDSSKNIYYYIASRHTLKKPLIRKLPNGTEIVNQYKTIVHKCYSKKDYIEIVLTPSPQRSPQKPANRSPQKPANRSPQKPTNRSPQKPTNRSPQKSPLKPSD
tara:strand:- start:137 stop:652 length:516 start_codon:yes stop_codon:yes gene_type:complete